MAISYDEFVKKKKKNQNTTANITNLGTSSNTPKQTTEKVDTEKLIEEFLVFSNRTKKQNTSTNKVSTEKDEDKKWYQQIINKGAMEDGFSVKNVAKTILGTQTDIIQNTTQGFIRPVEDILDIGTNIVASGVNAFGGKKTAEKIRGFADKNLSEGASNLIANVSPTGIAYNLLNGEPKNIIDPNANYFEEGSSAGYYADQTAELVGYALSLIYGGKALSGATKTVNVGSRLTANAGNIGVKIGQSTLNIPTLAVAGGMSGGLQEANSKEDVSEFERWGKATSSGLIEGISEGIFGMFGVGGIKNEAGKELFDGISEKVANKFSTSAAKTLANVGIKSFGESTEELVSYFLNFASDNLFVDNIGDADFSKEWDWSELGEQLALAFASSLIVQGGGTIIETNKAIDEAEKQLGRKLTNEEKATVTQASIEGTVEQKIGELQVQVQDDVQEKEESLPIQEETQVDAQVSEQVEEDIAPVTSEVISPTVEQNLTNITNQIDELETMLDTNLNATQQAEILTQIQALEQQYNEILQQQDQSQQETVFRTASQQNNVEPVQALQSEEIAPVQETKVEQTNEPTTQETNSNSAVEVESNTQETEKTPVKSAQQNNEDIAPIKERKTVKNDIGENLQDKATNVMTEEEYLASKGYGFMGYSEAGLHKGSKNESTRSRKQAVDLVQKRAQEYDTKRQELRKEYQAKLESGEIRKPTSIEQSLKTAQGNEDNPSVQAARRTLAKRGIDWRTGEKIETQKSATNKKGLKVSVGDTVKTFNNSTYEVADIFTTDDGITRVRVKNDKGTSGIGIDAIDENLSSVNEIAPVQKEIKSLTKEIKSLTKELKEIKTSVNEIVEEGKPLTIADLEEFYKQTNEDFKAITEQDAPTIQEDTTPDFMYENDNEGSLSSVESPLVADGRDIDSVGNRKIKAYQYEHPEVRPYFQQMAGYMQYDLTNSTKGERYVIGDISQTGGGNFEFSGTKRHTTQEYIDLITENNWVNYYNSIPSDDIAPFEESSEQDNTIAPVTNKSLAIEQAPRDAFDNGGPMIRVSPTMQKKNTKLSVSDETTVRMLLSERNELETKLARALTKTTENNADYETYKKTYDKYNSQIEEIDNRLKEIAEKRKRKDVDWNSLDDTSKGLQESFIPKKLGDTLTDTSISREQILADEQAEKFGMEAEEQNNAETITKILTEKPKKVKGKWDNVNRIKKLLTTKLLQKDYYISDMARKSKNQSLAEDSNNLRHANRISSQIAIDGVQEWNIDRTKGRRNGRFTTTQKAQGINQIYESLENAGLSQQFDDYAYNLHNIDRMNLEKKATDKMTELKNTTLKGYTVKQIEKMAKGIEPNDQQLSLDLKLDENEVEKVIAASKEYVRLSKEHNIPVFGYEVTSEISEANLTKYDEYKNTFEEKSKELTKLNDALLDFDVESGRLTQEEKEFIKDRYHNYVPAYYVDEEVSPSGKKYDKSEVRVREALDKAEGGNSELIPLKDAMQIKIRQKVNQNLMNKLGLNIMHTMEKQGNLNVLSSDSVEAYERYTKSNEELVHKMTDGGYALTVYENGDKITFEIPLEIYEALKPSDIFVVDTLNTLVDMKRALMTEYNLYFAVRNIMRDMPTAFLQSQNSAKWLMNVPEAVYQVAKKGQYYQLAQTLGAGNNDYANMNQRNFADIGPVNANDIQKQEEYEGNRFKTGWEKFKNWRGVKWIADVNAFMEQVPRMAEFITMIDTSAQENINPLTGGKYTYAQDEVTVNFGKGGDWTKTADRNITNFMNASLQGGMKLIDTFRDAYAYRGAKGLASTIMKYGVAGASLLALFNWAWDDDEDYEELSDYVKNNYYIIGKQEDGKFIKIPKGRTNAVIESVMNNGLKLISGEISLEDALKDTYSVIDNNIAPTTFDEANLFSTLKQIYTNTSWYGEDLVPTRLQDLPPEEQYDETTDKFSIWLGQKLGISPYKINYFINQSSGFVGDMVLPLLTEQAETPINNDVAELLLGQFYKDYTTDSVMKNQDITDFFELKDELKIASSSTKASDEDKLKNMYINAIGSQMNELYAKKREIQNNSDLTDSEKIEALRETQKEINALAKEGLSEYDNGTFTENYASIGGIQYQQKENEDGELYWSKIYDDESDELDSLGFTDNELNEYISIKNEFAVINDTYYASRDELAETYGKNSEEYEEGLDLLQAEKKNAVIDRIMNTNFTNEQKAYLYDRVYESKALDTITLTGMNIDYFLDYEKNEFKADYNSKGNAIPNSRKNKVISYINDYDLSIPEKAILIKSTNTFKFNDYNNEIVDYVSNLDIGYEDKVYVLEELGMTVFDDGTVEW